jgi:adenylate kinase
VARVDDNVETVRTRLDTYEKQTRPLADFYKSKGLLRTVDGNGDPEAIYLVLERIINSEAPVSSN